jgi:hypothetical protein
VKRQSLKRSLIFQKIFDESFRLVNPESQGIVKGLHIFPEGRFLPGDDFQTIAMAELADPPKKIAIQEALYVGDLLFPALGTDYFSYDLHTASCLEFAENSFPFINFKAGGNQCKPDYFDRYFRSGGVRAVREPPLRQAFNR